MRRAVYLAIVLWFLRNGWRKLSRPAASHSVPGDGIKDFMRKHGMFAACAEMKDGSRYILTGAVMLHRNSVARIEDEIDGSCVIGLLLINSFSRVVLMENPELYPGIHVYSEFTSRIMHEEGDDGVKGISGDIKAITRLLMAEACELGR